MKTIQVNEQMFRLILKESGPCQLISSERVEVSDSFASKAFRIAAKGKAAEMTYVIGTTAFGRNRYVYTFTLGGRKYEFFSAPLEEIQVALATSLDTARAAPSSN